MTTPVKTTARALAGLAGAFVLSGPLAAQDQRPAPPDPADYLTAPPKPASVKGRFSVASVGDIMLARPLADSPDPELQKVLALLRGADVAIGNQEGPALDVKTLTTGPMGLLGGLIAEPSMARDYKALGFDMVSVANNHSTDWGAEGLMRAIELLDKAGVAHAGGGKTLAEAQRAGFFDTPKGRIGLVATASTFKVNARANDAFGQLPGRPGQSTLRTRAVNLAPPEQMDIVRRLARELTSPLRKPPAPDAREVTLGEHVYRLSDKAGISYEMELYDHAAMLRSVREAKAQSDMVVFTIHAHESPTGVDDDTPEPPDFLTTLFHNTIDAGADMVMGGGPHALRGIEIYKGKPIFHGLGLFFFKPQLMGVAENVFKTFPDDGYPRAPDPRPTSPPSWFESVLAISDFDGGKLKQVRLYPIDLTDKGVPGSRGAPHLAKGPRAQEILQRLQNDSAPLGTKIAIENEVGVIRLP